MPQDCSTYNDTSPLLEQHWVQCRVGRDAVTTDALNDTTELHKEAFFYRNTSSGKKKNAVNAHLVVCVSFRTPVGILKIGTSQKMMPN